ncbi:UNKNOWN [Stylonychia lemnae]|uniref:VPS9 domain-containing protein n=1 Tax=Stylonychia lemnae TaxID=5949 RepID=A0A078B488_STYLE|nr:UNKNOWN [Stylonychia lemnae]|eukprot:CDW88022.1 UNKNOWN [Stylonychia lemnae]
MLSGDPLKKQSSLELIKSTCSEISQTKRTPLPNEQANCCFGFFSANKQALKHRSKKEKELVRKTAPYLKIFEDSMVIDNYNSDWVEDFLFQVQRALLQCYDKILQFQKEFQHVASSIVKHKSIDDYGNTQRQHNMIRPNLKLQQIRLYDEIESQIKQKTHPVQHLCSAFKLVFVNQYKEFVHKNVDQTSQALLDKIIVQTVGLQSDYILSLSNEMEQKDDDQLQEELEKKNEITLANKVLDDVKLFFSALYHFVLRMYESHLNRIDLNALLQDIAKLCIQVIVKDEVHKILICLVRIDNFELDRDIRAKYALLKGVQPADFGIDPYLQLKNPLILLTELQKQFKIDLSSLILLISNKNLTLQNQEYSEIKQFTYQDFTKQYKEEIDQLPLEISKIIYQKADVKPYYKSVLKFREIMIKPHPPIDKLFQLYHLKEQIQQEVQDYWKDIITDKKKILINRDELTSIMLFLIAKTEIPDLTSQLKLIQEFTSQEIQNGSDHSIISAAYLMFSSPILWFSSIDGNKLLDRTYLLRATMQMTEQYSRFDKISFDDMNDRYDPFSVANSYTLRNSYLTGNNTKTVDLANIRSFAFY